MNKQKFVVRVVVLVGLLLAGTANANAGTQPVSGTGPIAWQSFSPAAFAQAAREGKLVLLDLVAVWCHWCHVMDEKTYADPAVAAYIETHFIPVRADHDARPDLAERYREWGWPATVILDAKGSDVLNRAGYIEPEWMLKMLRAVVEDPSPERDTASPVPAHPSARPELSTALAETLRARHLETFDTVHAGLDIPMKFLDPDGVLWSLRRIKAGDREEEKRLRRTLDANRALIDPAFGGVYQYSTHGDWRHPHYEKIMRTQWANLMAYSRACTALEAPRYCAAGRLVATFLLDFLSAPDGGFYTSQDADLVQGVKADAYFALGRKARLEAGLPRIDKAEYAATTGMAISGLTELYLATHDKLYLQRAEKAAAWAVANRRLWGGGFRHDHVDASGPYLSDTLWMGRAFLTLYRATDNPDYLQRALAAAGFIAREFKHARAGLVAAVGDETPIEPLPQIDQNIQAALWLLDLARISKESAPLTLAEHVMRYLATPQIATARVTEAGILEADARLRAQRADGRYAQD